MGEEKIYVIIVPAVCRAYTWHQKNFFSFLTGGGIMAPEKEDSREFHALLYGRGAMVTVALIVAAMILFTIWE
jgi:hypothetical protein